MFCYCSSLATVTHPGCTFKLAKHNAQDRLRPAEMSVESMHALEPKFPELALPFNICITVGKLPNFSVSVSLSIKREKIIILKVFYEDFMKYWCNFSPSSWYIGDISYRTIINANNENHPP